MMIPINDLKKQIEPIRAEINAVVKKVINNANFILGSEVIDFENAVAEYCQVKYAVGVSNGTDAIRLALIALGVGYGDGVICPAFTYYATAGAIASIGAIPVFADINSDTYTISGDSVENVLRCEKIKNIKVKAIVPVHLYGQCADMSIILKIAKKHRLKVVEDAAQAFGAEYLFIDKQNKSKKAGTIGDCGSVSFFPGKNLGAFGDAGMVLTDKKLAAEKIKILRNQGNKNKYYHLILGHNNRMDAIQAAVLNVKLKYLDFWNKKRQENAEYYNRHFKGLEIKTPFTAGYTTHIYHQYILRLNRSSKELVAHLRNKDIDARVYYPVPLHFQRCFKYLGYKKGDFPESEKASYQTLAIPIYPDLARKEIDYIINSIKEVC